jgi:4-alpha-glucanotransferase
MNLILCIHNHQPVGNMDFILEEAYTRAYAPFFEVLKDYPEIKIGLHFSGYLFSWLHKNKPQYIALLKELKDRGQIEIVSGGMYEPVLSLLPEEDGVAQIGMHLDYMEEVFGERPTGAWLAERVYEPHIPGVLNKAGISYTLVDDNHFKAVGMAEEELYGYYASEFAGQRVFIFPGLEVLRYAIPFKTISEVDKCFREIAEKGGDLAVFGDDGEKFGLWPGTHASVYAENWLKEFFAYLTEQREWLQTVTFSQYIAQNPPRGLIYLDCQSYKEMGEWCLPARLTNEYGNRLHGDDPEKRKFLKGGYYKYFLVKYPESNDMHKKMLSLTRKAGDRKDVKNEIFMGQANDSYWHGVFGGLYLPHLRASVYKHLIEAEKLLDPPGPFVEGYFEDRNVDGKDEVILSNNLIEASFMPAEGGILYGLDYKPSSTNILATLMRRYEGYHDKVKEATSTAVADGTKTIHDLVMATEEGLEELLHYDWHRRASLIDHVMGPDATLDEVYKSVYVEPGDFVREAYVANLENEGSIARLSMTREGHFWKDGKGMPLSIQKRVVLKAAEAELLVDYVLSSDAVNTLRLGIEFNFSLLGSGGDRYLEAGGERFPLTAKEALRRSGSVMLHDPYQNVDTTLEFDKADEIWTFPVEVVSLSEHGFERNYQSTMVMPVWNLDLTKGPATIQIRLSLSRA